MTVEIPTDLAPFAQRLIAERQFLTEGDVLAEGLRLLQSQEALRAAVREGFSQLDEGRSVSAAEVFAKAREHIQPAERARRA
jgi:Arc/MetJ-type ribon-helix-helix transcriptional regulator